jgi:hypothetical protein
MTMLGNDGGQSWRLRTGVRCEQLGSQWLVLDVGEHELLRLSGPAAEILTRLAAGETTLPEHLDAAVGVLVAKGVLEPVSPPARGPLAWSRRRVLGLAAASAAAAGVAATVGIDSLVLPAAAQASSPGQFMVTSGGTESGTFEIDGVYYRTRTFVTGSTSGGTYTFSVTDLQSADSDRRTISYLVVGAGGGGGGVPDRTGGGGAGGIVAEGSITLDATGDFDITVGAGGRGGDDDAGLSPLTGGPSSLFRSGVLDVTAAGGGNGGQNGSGPGPGGGAYHGGGSGSTRDPGGDGGSGFDGGGPNNPPNGGNFAGGGGGGASANASGGTRCGGGGGGAGLTSSITGSSVVYGGGGGGGFQRISGGDGTGCPGTAVGPGGAGGGGTGAGYIFGVNSLINGTAGTNGLGGGGGGAAATNENTKGVAGSGGSGIVIIRFQVPPP